MALRRPLNTVAFHRVCHKTRTFSTTSTVAATAPYEVFDRTTKRIHRDRAAVKDGGQRSRTVDYVRDEVADRLMERFLARFFLLRFDIKRNFKTILDFGSGSGPFSKLLDPPKVESVIMLDSSKFSLHRDPDSEFDVDVQRVHADEESLLNVIEPNTQEAVTSCLTMHWVNDLPGALIQIKEVLKPDGLFLGAMFGGDTLFELRTSLQLAEVDREGGISPRVSPMTDTRDVSNLLGRAGFTLLTVDIDEVKVAYPSMWELMEDLQNMGEANAVIGRRGLLHRDTLAAASAIYKEMHGLEDGSIPATFQIIYMIGWKPAPSQPKPLERGTGKTNLKEVL
ncbi:S-adenosyl-L-methionine-dependent methyltransferase [Pluteus cervinus]|uniref:S-adenosyl-L-methionine-dependent methyltransferase n=1 Tax=Pluteus cervinus TaxID=181527 RepID=A0ACD3B203_9AGAR|nr:S-adenosyl-L-methionine-dependent methyltransferase [Pluteus cervinus]